MMIVVVQWKEGQEGRLRVKRTESNFERRGHQKLRRRHLHLFPLCSFIDFLIPAFQSS